MFDFSENRYFSDSSARDTLRLRLKFNFFESYDLLGGLIDTLVYDTVSTLSESFYLMNLIDLSETELTI